MARLDKNEVWRQVLASARVSVSSAIFSTWLSQTHLASLRKTDKKRYLAEIGCSSTFVKNTIETRYFGLIQDALIKIVGSPVDLAFFVKQDPDKSPIKTLSTPLFEEPDKNELLTEKLTSAGIRPGFTFQNFAVSSSNQMAWAAAEAVSSSPGQAYNPLFIWGGVGVGKTHLMHSVGFSLIRNNLEAKIVICTGEDFTNGIIQAIRSKTTPAFRDKYRRVDALFIDDIQFIAGKNTVQDEFFHTFNAVTTAGGQIILTSDKPPSEISRLEERLRSRFEAGLNVDIGQPDFELRCAIAQIKANEKKLDLATDLVHLIAGNIATAREIAGFVTRLYSEVKLRNILVTEELIKSLMGKKHDDQGFRKPRSPEEIINSICKHYSINKRALMGKARSNIVAYPRQMLMYILRTELKLPFQEIGRLIGNRDHSTVMYAVNKITNLASKNVQTREEILRIKNVS